MIRKRMVPAKASSESDTLARTKAPNAFGAALCHRTPKRWRGHETARLIHRPSPPDALRIKPDAFAPFLVREG
jgi:hypothetical protein